MKDMYLLDLAENLNNAGSAFHVIGLISAYCVGCHYLAVLLKFTFNLGA